MRKLITAALAVGLLAGALALPAVAGKKTAAQPVTFFFHGPFAAGEVDYAETTSNELQSIPDGFQVMDTTEPSDPVPDSMGLTNYFKGANRNCSGNALFPTWQGALVGKVSGDMKVYLNAIAGPATKVTVEVFPDSLGGCNSTTGSADYVEPVASTVATLTPGPGETEVVLKGVKFTSLSHVVVMVAPVGVENPTGETFLDPASQGRVLYDSADYASRVEFSCTPTKGKSCIPSS
jgi:hypothetical protein